MTFQTIENSYSGDFARPTNHIPNVYIVPIDKSFYYGSLTHDLPYNSTVYFNIHGAYPQTCSKFGFRVCDNNNIQQKITTDSILRG